MAFEGIRRSLEIGPGQKMVLWDLDGVLLLTEGKCRADAIEEALRRGIGRFGNKRVVEKEFYSGFLPFLERRLNDYMQSAKSQGKAAPYISEHDVLQEYLLRHLPGVRPAGISGIADSVYKSYAALRSNRTCRPRKGHIVLGVSKQRDFLNFLFTSRDPVQAVNEVRYHDLEQLMHGMIFSAPLPSKPLKTGLPCHGLGLEKPDGLRRLADEFGKENLLLFDDNKKMVRLAETMGIKAMRINPNDPSSLQRAKLLLKDF